MHPSGHHADGPAVQVEVRNQLIENQTGTLPAGPTSRATGSFAFYVTAHALRA